MPRNKLPEKTRQEIFAHWIQTNNYTQTAKVFGCSDNTVKNVVKDMPEFYTREHENQRQQFVKEAWLVARSALREIAQRLAQADLRDVSVAFGIISQRATNAMYAAQKMPSIFVQQQQVNGGMISVTKIHEEIFRARSVPDTYRPEDRELHEALAIRHDSVKSDE